MSNSFSLRKDSILPNHHSTNSSTSSSQSSRIINSLNTLSTSVVVPNGRKFLNRKILLFLILLFSVIFLSTSNLYELIKNKYNNNRYKILDKDLANKIISSSLELKEKNELWNNVGIEIRLNESLETRLRDWESSPSLEPAEWVTHNMKTCPATRITPNQNKVQLEQSHLLWSSLSESKIKQLREEMITFLRKSNQEGRMSKKYWGSGRGLVVTAGNADTFKRVLTTLEILNKHLNTHLPIEIFSFPGEIPEEATKKELESFGAKFLVVENAIKDSTKSKSYHIKATAIIRSSFREVLYLDSDNLPTGGLSPLDSSLRGKPKVENWSDSAGIWESKAYKRLGVMFWPDYWRTGADNPIWSIIGTPCRDEWEMEAGQILIDKSLHLDALLLSEWMMDSSRFKFWMNFSDGDKDIFRYAFLALRKRWGVPGRFVAVGAFPSDAMTGYGGHSMIQHDHIGRPLFVHANLLKQIPSGIGQGYAWGKSKSLSIPPNSLSLPPSSPFLSDSDPELEDLDIDCDQLANVAFEGNGIKSAPPSTRRRAALERGLSASWHGGWISALLIDMNYKDTRTKEEIEYQKSLLRLSSTTPTLSSGKEELDSIMNITITKDGLELYWGDSPSPLQVREWSDDIRLKDFENVFFEEGGSLSSAGF